MTRVDARTPRYTTRAGGVALVVILICAIGGEFAAEYVVTAIASAAGANELVARFIGWCWTGLPCALFAIAVPHRARVSERTKRTVGFVLATWFASSALLLPPRNGDLEQRLGSAYEFGRFLVFGWATGLLAILATVVTAVIGLLMGRRLGLSNPSAMNRLYAVLVLLPTAGGVAYAVLGPLP